MGVNWHVPATAAVLLLAGIAACTSAPPSTSVTTTTPVQAPAATAKPAPAGTPAQAIGQAPSSTPAATQRKPQGTLNVGLVSLVKGTWLGAYDTSSSLAIVQPVYEYLIELNEDRTMRPMSATKWEMSPDGMNWTFWLRKGVQFHDNWGELTGEDVKSSYQLLIKADSQNYQAGYWREYVKDVEVVDPYQVIFHMKKPSWSLIYNFDNVTTVFPISSKKHLEAVGEEKAALHPVGTGPYKFVEHKPGDYVKLEAIENHWRQTPYFQYLVKKVVPEDATRIAMLRTGELDIIETTPEFVAEVEKAGLEVRSMKNTSQAYVFLGGQYLSSRPEYDKNTPYAQPDKDKALKVRKALAMAIDKQETLQYVLRGKGTLSSQFSAWPGQPGYDPALQPYPYNPSEATKLLGEAGYPKGFEITMRNVPMPGRPYNSRVSESVAMYWQKIGLSVKQTPTDYATIKSLTTAHKLAGAAWVYPSAFYDEPALRWSIAQSNASLNWVAEDSHLDDLIVKAMGELNYDSRARIQQEGVRYIYDNYFVIPVLFGDTVIGVGPKVGKWMVVSPGLYLQNFEYAQPK